MSWFNSILGLIFIFSPNLFQLIIIHFYFTLNWPFFSKRTEENANLHMDSLIIFIAV